MNLSTGATPEAEFRRPSIDSAEFAEETFSGLLDGAPVPVGGPLESDWPAVAPSSRRRCQIRLCARIGHASGAIASVQIAEGSRDAFSAHDGIPHAEVAEAPTTRSSRSAA